MDRAFDIEDVDKLELESSENSQSILLDSPKSPFIKTIRQELQEVVIHQGSIKLELADLKRQSSKMMETINEMNRFIKDKFSERFLCSETQDPTASPEVHSKAVENGNKVFLSITGSSGIHAELILPENICFQLEGMKKERTVVNFLLKYFYPMQFLRKCTLTGCSGKSSTSRLVELIPPRNLVFIFNCMMHYRARFGENEEGSPDKERTALPADKVLLIQEACKKLLPSTRYPDSEDGKKSINTQQKRVKDLIRACLQYFRDEYDDFGTVRPERQEKRKKKVLTEAN